MELPVAAEWFAVEDEGDGVLRLWEPHVRALIQSNIYAVDGGKRSLVIDSGCGIVPIRPYLPPMGHEPDAVASHGHFDHVGGFHEFSVRMIHDAEAADMAKPDPMAALLPSHSSAPLRELLGPQAPECLITARPTDGFDPEDYVRRATKPTRVLVDGDVLDLGDRCFEVLHLPGHSPGSICLYERETGILFGGDVIYDGGLIDDVLPGTDRRQYVDSMRRLASLDLRQVFPGHGPTLSGDDAYKIVSDYVADAASS